MIHTHDDPRCEEALDWIEPYLDGDLPGEEADRLKAHLGRCPACAAELQLAERIQRELRALPQLDCPPEVLERVERAGRGEVVAFRPRQPRERTSLRFLAAAALLALSVGGGALFFHLQRPPDQPSPREIAQATADAKLALAYLGKATRRASADLQQEVLAKRLVVPATRGVARSLGTLDAGRSGKEF